VTRTKKKISRASPSPSAVPEDHARGKGTNLLSTTAALRSSPSEWPGDSARALHGPRPGRPERSFLHYDSEQVGRPPQQNHRDRRILLPWRSVPRLRRGGVTDGVSKEYVDTGHCCSREPAGGRVTNRFQRRHSGMAKSHAFAPYCQIVASGAETHPEAGNSKCVRPPNARTRRNRVLNQQQPARWMVADGLSPPDETVIKVPSNLFAGDHRDPWRVSLSGNRSHGAAAASCSAMRSRPRGNRAERPLTREEFAGVPFTTTWPNLRAQWRSQRNGTDRATADPRPLHLAGPAARKPNWARRSMTRPPFFRSRAASPGRSSPREAIVA